MKKEKQKLLYTSYSKGITLIALIITIILMLILLGVTVTGAIRGGIFSTTKQATSETQKAIDRQELQEIVIIESRKGSSEMDLSKVEENLQGGWQVNKKRREVVSPSGNAFLIEENGNVKDIKWRMGESGEITDGKTTIKIGDYVNYVPDVGTYKVAGGEYGTGYVDDSKNPITQEFTTETGEDALKWRVFSVNEGRIELVSEKAGPQVYLSNDAEYNHGVDILNDLCKTLYGKEVNGKKVAIGRSINMDDINSVTTYDYSSYENYGDVYDFGNVPGWAKSYPKLFEYENDFYVDGKRNTSGIGKSEGLGDGVLNDYGITEYHTAVGTVSEGVDNKSITRSGYGYYVRSFLDGDLAPSPTLDSLVYVDNTYWLATRYANTGSYYGYGLFTWSGWQLFGESRAYGTNCRNTRIVVDLNPDVSFSLDNFTSTDDATYWNIEF